MRAPRFIAHARTLRNYSRQLQHVVKLAGEHDGRVGPLRPVAQVHMLKAFQQFHQLGVGFLKMLVVTDYRAILGHQLAEFLPDLEWILRAA